MKVNKLYNLESLYANEPGIEHVYFLISTPIEKEVCMPKARFICIYRFEVISFVYTLRNYF